jgi:hypothetical protein
MRAVASRAPVLDRIAPGLKYALIVVACAAAVYLGTEAARARMERERARQAVCTAKLEALLARNLFAERFLRPADPCVALEVATR